MPSRVAWCDVSVSVPGKKKTPARTILRCASGYAAAGSGAEAGLVALMGASGSGKTTLLSCLAGHAEADAGELALEGRPYDRTTSARVGYVPQTDRLFATLTVLETLRLGAALRGARPSAGRADAADDARLDALLRRLGLELVANTRIGEPGATGKRRGVSGGERKRCALALELLHTPPLLVLDEPTSGLDAKAAADVMRVLAGLTAEQAVVISLHQPSSRAFAHVSQLGLLSSAGATIYFGPAGGAIGHFAALGVPVPPLTNPAEHYVDLAATDDAALRDKLLAAAHDGLSSPTTRALLKPSAAAPTGRAGRSTVGFGAQLRALLWRANLNNRRHPAFMRALMSRSVTMALLVGYLYSGLGSDQASVQDRTGALYFVLTNQIMSSSGSIRTFIAERDVAAHELRSALYHLPSYFLARSTAESWLHLFFSQVFGLVAYRLVGFAPSTQQLGIFLAAVALVTLCAESYVVLVGAVMPDDKSAAVVGPLFLALFMVSGGLFVNAATMPPLFRLFNKVNLFPYAFSALLQNEMSGLTLHCAPNELVGRKGQEVCPIVRGEQVVERMAMGGLSPVENLGVLLAMLVAYRLLAYLALRRRFR